MSKDAEACVGQLGIVMHGLRHVAWATFDVFRFESSCVFEDARDAPSRLKTG